MSLEQFDQWLEDNDLRGYWARAGAERPSRGRKASFGPHLWKWRAMAEALEEATRLIGPEDSFRRNITYRHPDLKDSRSGGGICHTFSIGVQCVQPGELPPAHRHRFGAMRFVIEGLSSGTVVNGEDFPMEAGDLITTPSLTWHDHYNHSEGRVLWLDIVDPPIAQFFQVMRSELYAKSVQDIVRPAGTSSALAGAVRPIWIKAESPQPPPYRYPWTETRRALELLAEEAGDPYDGITVRFLNPLTGGSTIPTLSCEVQMLRPGETTGSHRHSCSVAYYVFGGQGRCVVDGQVLDWEQGDMFVVPLWAAHHHENAFEESAYLFSVSDRGAVEALGLYEEEPA